MALCIVGTLVDVEDVPEYIPSQGQGRPRPAHKRLHIFAGREVLRARVHEQLDQSQLPAIGQALTVEVRANPWVNRQTQRAELSFTAMTVVTEGSSGRRVASVA